jgi:hypothetical protein
MDRHSFSQKQRKAKEREGCTPSHTQDIHACFSISMIRLTIALKERIAPGFFKIITLYTQTHIFSLSLSLSLSLSPILKDIFFYPQTHTTLLPSLLYYSPLPHQSIFLKS